MVAFDEPRHFTKEVLAEEGFLADSRKTVPMTTIEFTSKNEVFVDSVPYGIYSEGVKEFAKMIGINFGFLSKLPEELFAINLNYFLRRGEDQYVEIFFDENENVTGVHLDETFRLSFDDVFNLVKDCTKDDLLFSEFARDGSSYTITVLAEERELETGETAYPSLTIQLDDRLMSPAKFTFGVFRWGALIFDTAPHIESDFPKNATIDVALDVVSDDLTTAYQKLPNWFDSNLAFSQFYEIEEPRKMFDKVLKESNIKKKRSEILDRSEIFDIPLTAFDVATRISDTSVLDAFSPSVRRKMEKIAGYAFSHVANDHRCEKCLNHVEETTVQS